MIYLCAGFLIAVTAQEGMAVYTHLDDSQIDELLNDYTLGEFVSAQPIVAGIDNSNYLLKTTQGKFILTLYESRLPTEDLPFYLHLMSYMQSKGIDCPRTQMRKDGELLSKVQGRFISITSFLQGSELSHIQPQHLTELGAFVAQMHKATEGFDRTLQNSLAPNLLFPLFDKVKDRLDEFAPNLANDIADELTQMQNWSQLDLPRGVIHADIFPDNVFFIGDELTGIIDFYFACEEYLAYDLAVTFNAWCFDGVDNAEFNLAKAQQLISAYHKARPLSDAELDLLSFLARCASIRCLLTRSRDWFFQVEGAVVKPHDPMEYVKKWQFHSRATPFKEYIL